MTWSMWWRRSRRGILALPVAITCLYGLACFVMFTVSSGGLDGTLEVQVVECAAAVPAESPAAGETPGSVPGPRT